MDIRKLQRVIVNALEDVKAQDIKIFMEVKENGGDAVGIEGLETGEWVLVDCGSAIVHIMQPALRAYYNLEELWGAHPVHMKLLENEDKEEDSE